MTNTENTSAVTLGAEELAKLKENYVTFCNRIAEAKNQIGLMDVALQQGDPDPVLKLWKPLKDELEVLNTMALQLNKGDYGLLAREQLESLLEACNVLYQKVLDIDTDSDTERRQQAHNAYSASKKT